MPVRRLAAALAFAVVVLAGCREAHGATRLPTLPLPATGYVMTPGGVPVSYPAWLDAAERAEAESAIDGANPPVPPGWVVEVVLPEFLHPERADVRLEGLTVYDERRIVVGVRPTRGVVGLPVLPVLQHEVDHAVTGDPCFNHAPGTCP